MIDIIPFEDEKVVGVKIFGKIETESLEKVTTLIEKRLKTIKKLNIYVEFSDGLKFSPEALYKDIKFAFAHLGDFEKEAIVSDKNWLEKLIPIANRVYPSIEVRHFSKDEADQAKRWIQE